MWLPCGMFILFPTGEHYSSGTFSLYTQTNTHTHIPHVSRTSAGPGTGMDPAQLVALCKPAGKCLSTPKPDC